MDREAIKFEWRDAEFQAMCDRLVAADSNLLPLMAEIGSELEDSTRERFQTKTAPDGVPWVPLRPSSLERKKGTLLLESGDLRDSVQHQASGNAVEIFYGKRYGDWHQQGTDPYEIRPRAATNPDWGSEHGGGALWWPGARHPVAKVFHPGLPARPFLGVSDADREAILEATRDFVAEVVWQETFVPGRNRLDES